ncbi:MAG TPA: hypothetical protein VNT50_04560 [Microbacterium sp.]|uniref:hypothetical protein n=1 Tax=Microbacterium sp. TaxID=51671 RepID=UPI002CACD6F5|nr:hypothetical protein [Microbacterium sp.]HWI30738.1 hypothetical protein [Microbacterium sp.]
MSTPEQPGESQLTRKQLREIRMTGSTPIIGPDTVVPPPAKPPAKPPVEPPVETVPDASPENVEDAVEAAPAVESAPAPAVHLPRAAEPLPTPPLPIADAHVDLGVSALTRRQARQQERIRTASVPVITPDLMAAQVAAAHPTEPVEAQTVEEPAAEAPQDAGTPAEAPPVETEPAADAPSEPGPSTPVEADEAVAIFTETNEGEEAERPILRPGFGAELLAGAEPVALPPSFDQLIARNATSTGSQAASNALILSQTPSASPIVGPVTATGEVLITGSMSLPDGLGSTGHANGTADGKETDAVLIDRELPAHSSPTPIAASAAISTVKGSGEMIRPPAPEKGSRLMLTLAITAGALALALVGVLILAFVTGVF